MALYVSSDRAARSRERKHIFKKGVSLDRPTCLAAVENFTRGNRENYLRVDDDQFEALVKSLSLSPTEVKKKIACRKAVDHLFGRDRGGIVFVGIGHERHLLTRKV